jgi:predicted enzyme related to lactoylglutathione lyase
MNAEQLKAMQAPIKDRYRNDPAAAVVTLKAEGRMGEGIACRVDTGRALVEAGLHPATGGSGTQACSGDMLLEALVACAGVTLKAPEGRDRPGRRRPGFPRHPRRREGRPGRLPRHPPALRPRQRRERRAEEEADRAHRALLRGAADPPRRAAGGRRGVSAGLLVNIDVDDLERATRFYCDGLGLKVGRRFEGWTELVGAAAPIYLLPKPAGSAVSPAAPHVRDYARHWTPVHLDFVVPDVAEAVERAVSAGATLERAATRHAYGLLALLADPFGNGFCLLQFTGRGYDEIVT